MAIPDPASTYSLDEASDAQVSEYKSSPPADLSLFKELTRGLSGPSGLLGTGRDSDGNPINGSLGQHSIRAIREASERCRPTSILEIGFNMGYSAAMWLHFNPNARIVSVDISGRDVTRHGAAKLKERYGERFEFVQADSADPALLAALKGEAEVDLLDQNGQYRRIGPRSFDLAFIDGDHSEAGAVNDIRVTLELGVDNLVLDDWWRRFGPGVKAAVAAFPQLQRLQQWGNVVLFRNGSAREAKRG